MAQICEASQFPRFRSIRDHRTRADMVKPGAIVAKHIQADSIVYQPGDTSARHYHKDVEHLFIVTKGEGVLHAGEQTFQLKQGTVALVEPEEIHWFENPSKGEFAFFEFWAPPPTETVWVDEGDM